MNVEAVLDKLKTVYGLDTDQALADFFGVTRPNIANWRSRNSMNYALVVDKCRGVSLDWLYRDEGEPFLSSPEGRKLRAGKSPPSSHFLKSSEPSEAGMLEFFEYLKERYKLTARWEDLDPSLREEVKRGYQLMVSELHMIEAQYAKQIVSALLKKEAVK